MHGARARTHTHTHTHSRAHAHVHTYVTHAYPQKDACARTLNMCAHAHAHALTRALRHVCHARICKHVRTFTQGCVCAHARACARTHTHAAESETPSTLGARAYERMSCTHMHTCTHVHTRTNVRARTHDAHARMHTRPSHKRLQLFAGSEPETPAPSPPQYFHADLAVFNGPSGP